MGDPAEAAARKAFLEEGLAPEVWSNTAGYEYGRHSHPHHKVLYCLAGSIVFRTPDGDVSLEPGDRLDLAPGTPHSATVGPDGVTCMEGSRS